MLFTHGHELRKKLPCLQASLLVGVQSVLGVMGLIFDSARFARHCVIGADYLRAPLAFPPHHLRKQLLGQGSAKDLKVGGTVPFSSPGDPILGGQDQKNRGSRYENGTVLEIIFPW